MSTRSGLIRQSVIEPSPPRTRKGVSPPRSPARTRKISPSRSSTIKSAPSPTRKSPSRKSTSKNPAPKSQLTPEKESGSIISTSPSKRPAIKLDVDVKLKDLSVKLDFYRNTRSRRFEYSIKDIQSTVSKTDLTTDEKINGFESHLATVNDNELKNRKFIEEVPSHRSTRLHNFIESAPEFRRSISKSLSKSVSKSIGTLSDGENSDDELQREKSKSVTRRLATPLRSSVGKLVTPEYKFEFGGIIGPVLLIILIPVTVFSILLSCSKFCSHSQLLNLSEYKSSTLWFNNKSLILVVAQYIIQAAFVVVPLFGLKVEQRNGKGNKQCFNAFFSSICTVSILFALDYIRIIKVDAILELYLSLALVAYINGVLLAIFLYIRSNRLDNRTVNSYGNTGYSVNDFFVGREVYSSIKNLNIKLWISRISNITSLILLILIFKCGFELPSNDLEKLSLDNYRDFLSKVRLKPTILLFSMMQLIYVLNFILKEHKIETTFYWQSEGLGYLQTISSALYPFYFTSISKYVADIDLNMSTNALVAALTLFLVGFVIMLLSNNIKHDFRRNPFHPSLAHLDSMPTLHGNKLLVSNLWGIVRHPNYTGDILIHIALTLPGILTRRPMAALPAILTIVVLLHRAWRDHGRCSRRYGAAWQRYCKRVPSVVIPKIL
ncbi:unnamed protein product [Parnassius apollo]|uniref:(apollo) hypothetical protein n=1 Tax=Parnassius apollo TaxID=110799 RepID=A0A8S3WQ49_PARAO|nr:unnamed protein product [Parnassius apollo]